MAHTVDSELNIEAAVEKLPEVQSYVEERLESVDGPLKTMMQIGIAVEEIFVNIASYAYPNAKGMASVRVELTEDPRAMTITFTDQGIPYDPLAKEDPDVTLSAQEREVGGLGIFMTKKVMDEMRYEYKDNSNILTLIKKL